MTTIINIQSLKKYFGEIKAVDGISFKVQQGEMFGLVGPDGAGKTTTIKTLCGLLNPDSGSAVLFDKEITGHREIIQKEIGYLSQKFSLYGDLTVDENIQFTAQIHNIKNFKVRREELLEFTRLKPFRSRQAEKLSGGMKQKLALACSLIHKPKIIFLDEPTTGVDPVSRRDFWKILSKLLQDGITIFMTTPYLDEAERCNRIALMNKGKLIAVNTPSRIKHSMQKQVVEIVSSPNRKAYKLIKENSEYEVQIFGDRINVVVDNYETEYPKIEQLLKAENIKIKDNRLITPTLENVFIHLIKEAG